jgi:hypothetical protein
MTIPAHHFNVIDLTAALFGLDDITLIVNCCDAYREITLPLTLRAWSEQPASLANTAWPITIRATYKPRHLKQVAWHDLNTMLIKHRIAGHLWRTDRKNVRLRPKNDFLQFEGLIQFHAKFV